MGVKHSIGTDEEPTNPLLRHAGESPAQLVGSPHGDGLNVHPDHRRNLLRLFPRRDVPRIGGVPHVCNPGTARNYFGDQP